MVTRKIPLLPAGAGGRFAGPTQTDAELAKLARALGHPARAAIVRLLLEGGECNCGDIVDQVPLAQATVSQHLKVLREAGWIVGEVDGPRVCYCADPEALRRFRSLLKGFGSLEGGRRRQQEGTE
jgi:ArsR family transcriptional regulator, arsenate/arsenite/antimonite-responsive transcriptional repressor